MEDQGDVLDVGQAASRLGISPDGVRKRIRRGSLKAHKVDGEWRVVLPDVLSVFPETPPVPPETVQDTARDAALTYLQREHERVVQDNERLIEATRTQAETIAEQTRTIAELVSRLERQTVPTPVPPHAHQEAATPPPRRGWLRRLLGR